MHLLALLRRESAIALQKFVLMSAVAGLSNAVILSLINTAIEEATELRQHRISQSIYFAATMIVFNYARRYVLNVSVSEMERVLDRVRTRLAHNVVLAELQDLEALGRPDIFAALNTNTMAISESEKPILAGTQGAALLFFTLFYLAWLSFAGFVLLCMIGAVAVSSYFSQRRALEQDLEQANTLESRFNRCLTQMLDGFKEIKMNEARGADLYRDFQGLSRRTRDIYTRVQTAYARMALTTHVSFYICVAAVIFILPKVTPARTEPVVELTTVVLFLIGPIMNIMNMLPSLATANLAARNIAELEQKLQQRSSRLAQDKVAMTPFEKLSLRAVTFQYPDGEAERPFGIGPIDFDVLAGEIVFVGGGNGGGKSTLLKVLTALYPPDSGLILVDGQPVTRTTSTAYRSIFATIFSDYHLFDRLYGLPPVDEETLRSLLDMMELTGKVRVSGGEIGSPDLSTGQKKRLALIVAMLEDRPIYVFDEWAADQDPNFRRKFYHEILPELKKRGKTIIAVTHDDRYFPVADRLYVMEEGKLVAVGAS